MARAEPCYYACVYETDRRIIYGRAPSCDAEAIVDQIKRSLNYHNLIGLQSKVFLRPQRFVKRDVTEYCEQQMNKDEGTFAAFKTTKLDLRWGTA